MTTGVPTGAGPDLPGHHWVRALGAGGFADVHLYRQDVPARDVAVKVVRTSLDRRGVDVLTREADAMALVSGHPAVVALYAVGTTADGRRLLEMEYCPVVDIGERVRAHPLAVRRVLEIMIPICAGVEVLHRRSMVHRDIKPSNIMLNAFGRPVLGDFGVALATGSRSHGADDGFSVLWAPPEQQVAGTAAHPTQDVWALATTTWTLLTGRSPFEDPLGDNSALAVATRVQAGRLPALGRVDAPPALEEALRQALVVDPAARTPGAAEFGRALQKVQTALHLPLTSVDLELDTGGDRGGTGTPGPGAAVLDGERTRVRALPVVDASGTSAGVRSFEFTDPHSEEDTPEAPADPLNPAGTGSGTEEKTWTPPPRRRPVWVVVLVALLCVVGAAGLVVAMLTGGGATVRPPTPQQSSVPEDPVGSTTSPVESLEGLVKDGRVHWSWRHEGTEEVTGYFYTATAPGVEDRSGRTTLGAVDLVAEPGSNCLEVTAQGGDGRQSDPVSACVDVP